MVYKYTSSLNFNVLTTFTLQPSSVFHCLKKCSPHFALNWWVCIAKVGYYKHCSHHRFRNRFIRENANWRNGMECGGDQELPGLNARKACPGASPQHTHCSTLRTENWELKLNTAAQNLQFQCCVKFASGVVHLVLHLSFLLGEGDSICQLLGGWTTIMIWIHFFVLLSRIGGLQPPL